MPKRIYVGNLPFDLPKQDIHNAFSKFGPVESVKMDQDRPGQASVDMTNTPDAQKAVQTLNNSSLGGKSIQVKLG